MNEKTFEKVCVYCKKNPGLKLHSKVLWNGFLDKDTNQLVCFGCKEKHYEAKSKTEYRDLYAEFPIYAND